MFSSTFCWGTFLKKYVTPSKRWHSFVLLGRSLVYSKIISSGRNFTSIQNFNIQQQTLLRLKDFQLLPLIFSCLMFHKRINAAYPEKKEKNGFVHANRGKSCKIGKQLSSSVLVLFQNHRVCTLPRQD